MTEKNSIPGSKKRIGVDLDDVLMNFNDSLQDYHNQKYGTHVERHMLTNFDIYPKVWECSLDESIRRTYEFMMAPEHDTAFPVEGAREAVGLLSKEYELYIITSRGDQVSERTNGWIERHFPKIFKAVHLTNQYYGVPERVRSKTDVCKELGIEFMIEDSISQVRQIAPVVNKVFLLDCPWNQGDVPKNVQRVYSWNEIAQALL